MKLVRIEKISLSCPLGHVYPILDDIPVLLVEEIIPTQKEVFDLTRLRSLASRNTPHEGHVGCSAMGEKIVDLYVQDVVSATCGIMYSSLIGKLNEYPIPSVPLPGKRGQRLLDIGCNWGRWCMSAARAGYLPIGIDPNIDAIMAARRVAKHVNICASYLVADARNLPFCEDSFDVVFSYSVLQHFDKRDVIRSLSEISRTLKTSAFCMIQMPNIFGMRNLYHQIQRGFRKPELFDVRYWYPSTLIRVFNIAIGKASLFVDGFFSLNPDIVCSKMLPVRYRVMLMFSHALRIASTWITWLTYLADSVYVRARKK